MSKTDTKTNNGNSAELSESVIVTDWKIDKYAFIQD